METKVDITKDVQALHKFNEIKELTTVHGEIVKVEVKESTEGDTYYFLPDDSVIHEDNWNEIDSASGDYWTYQFGYEDEQVLLDYYLGEADQQAVDNICHVLVMGDTSSQSFHHALFCVLKEFR